MLKATGSTNCQVYETVRYSSYGVPFGITPGDIEPDGDVDDDDNSNWPGSYQVRCDYDLDGDLDTTDQNFTITNSGRTLGRGVLSHSSVANRKGYAGYEHDGVIDTLAHVRHRVLMTELGRWSRRDPLGYLDSTSLVAYVLSMPVVRTDWSGLRPDCTSDATPVDEDGPGPKKIARCAGNQGPIVVPTTCLDDHATSNCSTTPCSHTCTNCSDDQVTGFLDRMRQACRDRFEYAPPTGCSEGYRCDTTDGIGPGALPPTHHRHDYTERNGDCYCAASCEVTQSAFWKTGDCVPE